MLKEVCAPGNVDARLQKLAGARLETAHVTVAADGRRVACRRDNAVVHRAAWPCYRGRGVRGVRRDERYDGACACDESDFAHMFS